MKRASIAKERDDYPTEGLKATLEKKFIEEYLRSRGYLRKDLRKLTKEQAKQRAKNRWEHFPRVPMIPTEDHQRVVNFIHNDGSPEGVYQILVHQARGSVGECLEAIQAAQLAAYMFSNDIEVIED